MYEYSLIEDQRYILDRIVELSKSYHPNAVVIAGDIYDKSVPTVEAVSLFDDFLTALSELNIEVMIINGNHDSPERIAFGGRLMLNSGVHISQIFNGTMQKLSCEDEYGKNNFYLLPFIKPAMVRRFYPEKSIETTADAVAAIIGDTEIDKNERNILVAHQFVTGANRSDSEELSVGGSDNVDVELFDCFDYVALGHIHGPQNIGKNARYPGSPLKYSFSESGHKKSVTMVEIRNKGEVSVKELYLKPLHELYEIKGKYSDLTLRDYYANTTLQDDYLHIILTDEDDIIDAVSKLRVIYKRLMKLSYENDRTASFDILPIEKTEEKSPMELFSEFFKGQNGHELSEDQSYFLSELIGKVFEK